MQLQYLISALLALILTHGATAGTIPALDVCYAGAHTCQADWFNLNLTVAEPQKPTVVPGTRRYEPGGSGPAGPESATRKNRRERGGVMSVSNVYRDANVHREENHWHYDQLKVNQTDLSRYEFGEKIGRGTFSSVFTGTDTQTNERIIIKRLKSKMDSRKIKREIKVLQALHGGPNIINLLDVSRNLDTGKTSFIFEYVENDNWRDLFPKFTIDDIRYYIFEVLKALEYAHKNGVMHRDIKPHNIVVDYPHRKIRVIDWGLGEFYFPNKEYNVRVASRHFKGPELLVGIRDYDYSLDIWSLGCVLAGMVFQKDKFFYGEDNDDQLVKIAYVLGTKDLHAYVNKYGLSLSATHNSMVGERSRKPWIKFRNEENAHLFHPDAIDLIDRMIVYDHQKRISAKDALAHPFFDSVREGNSLDKSSGIELENDNSGADAIIDL